MQLWTLRCMYLYELTFLFVYIYIHTHTHTGVELLNRKEILKSRDITLATKVRVVKAMVFLVVMYGCESWTIKKAESWRIDFFFFWNVVLEKTLESPLDCKEIQPVHLKGDQSWVFIGRTDVEAQASNTLTIWSEKLTHWKRPCCWEREKAGGEGDDRGQDGWMHHRLNGHESSRLREMVKDREAWHAAVHEIAKSDTMSKWTTTKCVHAQLLQSCPTLCSRMNSSPPGSCVHGILQERILEWAAMPSSRGSAQPKDGTHVCYVPCIGRWVLYHEHHLRSPVVD